LAYELLLTADQSFQLQEGIGKSGCEKVQAKAVCVGLGQAYASSIADIVSSMGYQHDQDFAIAPELARVAERSGLSAKDLNLPWEALTLSVEARDKSEQGLRVEGANRTTPVSAEPIEVELATIEMPDVVFRQMPHYQRATFPVSNSYEPHEAPVSMLSELAWKIVEAEGPIHVEEVARRVAACFGKEKAGSRIRPATQAALSRARPGNVDLLTDGVFWYTRGQADAPPVRDRSAETGATLKAANISMLEIKAAFKIARDDNAGGDDDDLVRTVARLLGFKRVGPDLQARIAEGL
jgi:hypothetical protein